MENGNRVAGASVTWSEKRSSSCLRVGEGVSLVRHCSPQPGCLATLLSQLGPPHTDSHCPPSAAILWGKGRCCCFLKSWVWAPVFIMSLYLMYR